MSHDVRKLLFPLLKALLIALFLLIPATCWATSASIDVSGNEGAITVSATASFTTHTFCNNKKPPDCWTNSRGSLSVYRNGGRFAAVSGDGSASWSDIHNAATLAQSVHTYTATACDSKNICDSSSFEVTIDNTPEITITSSGTEGDMEIRGTVDFKENPFGNEGRVDIYLSKNGGGFNRQNYYNFNFNTPDSTPWTWAAIVRSVANAGAWGQGDYVVRAQAVAANGATSHADLAFTIDNTPVPVILGSKCHPDDTIDIYGTTTFKENTAGNEGTLTIFIRELHVPSYTQHGSVKSYEGTEIGWKYADFTGRRLQKSIWGQKEIMVKILARAANGATASVERGMVIPAMGCPFEFGE